MKTIVPYVVAGAALVGVWALVRSSSQTQHGWKLKPKIEGVWNLEPGRRYRIRMDTPGNVPVPKEWFFDFLDVRIFTLDNLPTDWPSDDDRSPVTLRAEFTATTSSSISGPFTVWEYR